MAHFRTALLPTAALISSLTFFSFTPTAQASGVVITPADRAGQGFAFNANGEHWRNGVLEWRYNPDRAPKGAPSTDEIVAAVQQAAAKWMDVCNVQIVYRGQTSALPLGSKPDMINTVGWAAFAGEYEGMGSVTAYFAEDKNIIDADTALNDERPGGPYSVGELESAMTRAFGFALGLSYSDNPQSVMYGKTLDQMPSLAFQRILRGDDVAGCVKLYGETPQTKRNRVLNWGDAVVAAGGIGPTGRTTQYAAGYYYRYYPEGNTFVGEQNGTFYVLFPGQEIMPVGTMDELFPQAEAAGF